MFNQLDFGPWVIINVNTDSLVGAIFVEPYPDDTNPSAVVEHWAFKAGGLKQEIDEVVQTYKMRKPDTSVAEQAPFAVKTYASFKAAVTSVEGRQWDYIPAFCPPAKPWY
jgi:hypothetical protein